MVLGMSSESIDVIRQFVAEQGVTFPILHDKSGVVRAVYRLSGGLSPYPRDYIIDQDGIILDRRLRRILRKNLLD